MTNFKKKDFPVTQVRRFLEPGPIVLVSSAWKGKTNIMTMGWHMIMEFEPSLVSCYIWTENHSFDMIRNSRECVINVPTVDIGAKVVGIGNSSGRDIDKFAEFGLTAVPGDKIKAPLIGECFANFECKLVDSSLIRKYSLFVPAVVTGTQPSRDGNRSPLEGEPPWQSTNFRSAMDPIRPTLFARWPTQPSTST
jgi:flavin reductase (DIM6/NTAB) family NADH-FMN oxidoreductase RutF